MDPFTEYSQQHFMRNVVETPFDVSLNKPLHSRPAALHAAERGVATTIGTEPVGAHRKLWFEVRVQNGAHDLLQQLIGPGRQAERAQCPILFRDMHASDRCPSKAFMAEFVNEAIDLHPAHAIHGFSG